MFRSVLRAVTSSRTTLRLAGDSAAQRSGKSRARQAIEMLGLRARGYNADDYYTLRLYEHVARHASPPISRREFSQIRLRLNPRHVEVVAFNKWVQCLYFEALGIRVPRCHGLYHPSRGVTREGQPLTTLAEVRGLVRRHAGSVVFKPLDASSGQGVMVLASYDGTTDRLVRASGTSEPLEALFARLGAHADGWVIQERVEQHPLLAKINASSVNTVRLMTLVAESGEVGVIGAVLRMGVGHSEIDNTEGGGIFAPIELDHGTLAHATSQFGRSDHDVHPDSGARIRGMTVPHWKAVREVATRAHRLLPFPRTLGWDIAVTLDGPVIIEVNSDYYYNHLQSDGQSPAINALRQAVAG